MANTAIPLSVQPVDAISPLMMLQQNRAQQQQQAQQAEQQQYERGRQQQMDKLTIADLNQQSQARGLEMEGQQLQNKKAQSEFQREALQFIARDTVAFDNLVQSGDLQSAAILGQEMKRTAADHGLPTQGFDEVLSLFSNPAALKAKSTEIRKALEPQLKTIFGGDNQAQFGGQIQVKDEAGNIFFATTARDPSSGAAQTVLSPIGNDPNLKPQGQVQVVGQFGETGDERTTRAVEQSRGVTAASEEEKRASDLIDRGVAAAESTSTTRRALALLDTVETGGPEAFALAVKQQFGIEGADEGELSNTLGKSVLSQLRETFGAAFTENEGARLQRIEASFNKSPATNKRLLQQVLRIQENVARRAQQAAKDRGQAAVVADIDDLLTFSLDTAPQGNSSPQDIFTQADAIINGR
jgi:hypothetical protein